MEACVKVAFAENYTRSSYISNTFISKTRLKLGKNQANLSNILRLNFCYLKIIRFLHPRYHLKTIKDTLCAKISVSVLRQEASQTSCCCVWQRELVFDQISIASQ